MMKLTLGWLKEHLKTARPLDEIAGKLTMIGLEVERIEDKAKLFAPFVIARVIEARRAGTYVMTNEERAAIEDARNSPVVSEEAATVFFWKQRGIG